MCVYCTKNVHLFGYKCTGVSDPNPYPYPNPHTTPYPNHNRIIALNTSGPRPHTHLNTVCLLSDALTSLFCILSYLVLSCLGLLDLFLLYLVLSCLILSGSSFFVKFRYKPSTRIRCARFVTSFRKKEAPDKMK